MPIRKSSRTLLAGTSALTLAFAATILVSSPAAAATVPVSNDGELRAAITAANSNVGADTVTLADDITLATDLPDITDDLTVVGTGFSIDGAGHTAFTVVGASPNISTTFTNVSVTDAESGIDAEDSNVTITGSTFDDATVIIDGDGITVNVAKSSFDNASGSLDGGMDLKLRAGSVATITTTSADHNTYDGIWVKSESSTVTITDSSADANGDDGFDFHRSILSTMALSRTSADDNLDDGYDAEMVGGSTLKISAATATGNGSDGMELDAEDTSTVAIIDSSADENVEDGFALVSDDHSTVTAARTSADANGDDGFNLDASNISTMTLTDTSADENVDDGFDAELTGTSTVDISSSTAARNIKSGLEMDISGSSSANVTDSVFADSSDDYGVQVTPEGDSTVSLTRVAVTGNEEGGVWIDDDGYDGVNNTVTISDSTIADNDGTGIDLYTLTSTDVVVRGTTISGNSGFAGGGIYAELYKNSSLSVLNSTVSGNTQNTGGAVSVHSGDDTASITIARSTIANNASTNVGEVGGMSIAGVQYSIDHSIIAGNTADGIASDLHFDASTPATGSIDYSLIQASTGSALTAVDAGTGNLKNMSAKLGALADNGGRTLTHLPLDGSPVLNAGNPAITGAPATDQRGQTRIVGIIDLGSVEAKKALLPATGSNPTIALTGGAMLLLIGVVILIVVRYRRKR